ncbi:hypothetical protein AVEN_61236-1, partial [Araneus ventricosus]
SLCRKVQCKASDLVPDSKPNSTEETPCKLAWSMLDREQSPTAGLSPNLEEDVPAQVWSSTSDHGTKFQGPSQNNPRNTRDVYIPKKKDVNITKLNKLLF